MLRPTAGHVHAWRQGGAGIRKMGLFSPLRSAMGAHDPLKEQNDANDAVVHRTGGRWPDAARQMSRWRRTDAYKADDRDVELRAVRVCVGTGKKGTVCSRPFVEGTELYSGAKSGMLRAEKKREAHGWR